MVITRAMDEEMKKFLAGLTAQLSDMKSGQDRLAEDMKSGQDRLAEDMKSGQDRLAEEMKANQEETKKDLASVKGILEEKMSAVQNRVQDIEDKISKIEESLEERMEGKIEEKMEEKFSKVEDRVSRVEEKINYRIEEEFEKKIKENLEKKTEENFEKVIDEKFERKIEEKFGRKVNQNFEKEIEEKFEKKIKDLDKKMEENFEMKIEKLQREIRSLPVNEQSRTNSSCIKLSTYDGKSAWQVYKTQFAIVAEANRWDSIAKACHLAAALRGEAADILQTLSEDQRHNFEALSSALEFRFGEKCFKDYSRLQLKSRYQKVGETLQEFASDVDRLAHLAYPDCPSDLRENLAMQGFVDGVRDSEIQKALRMADVPDLKSALVYALKFEAAQQASRKDRHSVRAVSISTNDSDSRLEKIEKSIESITKEIRSLKGQKDGRNQKIKCWTCGAEGHVRRYCPARPNAENGNTSTSPQGN